MPVARVAISRRAAPRRISCTMSIADTVRLLDIERRLAALEALLGSKRPGALPMPRGRRSAASDRRPACPCGCSPCRRGVDPRRRGAPGHPQQLGRSPAATGYRGGFARLAARRGPRQQRRPIDHRLTWGRDQRRQAIELIPRARLRAYRCGTGPARGSPMEPSV
jgi:hypothetical protein